MTEYGYVEEAMLEWLAGKDDDPNDHGLGWTYRSEADMEVCGRSLTDPIVEALLIPALMRINPAVDIEGKARKVVDALRRMLSLPDPLDANRRTLEALRDGIPVVLAEYKSYITSGHDWTEGVNQLHRYQREAPALLVPNVFSV